MKVIFIIFLISGFSPKLFAEKGHKGSLEEDHHHNEKISHSEEDHLDKDNDHHKGHEKFGSDKGVINFDAEKGLILSEQAKKNFSIETFKIINKGPWIIPVSSLLYSGPEINIYRERNGYLKRIEIEVIRKNSKDVLFKSLDLKDGDSIISSGVKYVKIVELDMVSGEDSHHH